MRKILLSALVGAIGLFGASTGAKAALLEFDLLNGNDPGGNLFAFYNGGKNFVLESGPGKFTFDTHTGEGTIEATIVRKNNPSATTLDLFVNMKLSDTNADGVQYKNTDKYAVFQILDGSFLKSNETGLKYNIAEKPISPIPRGLEVGKTSENGTGEVEVEAWLTFSSDFQQGPFCTMCYFNPSATSDIDLSMSADTLEQLQVVPLPASGLFLIAGLGALAASRRRKS